jgi:hypothetical protein
VAGEKWGSSTTVPPRVLFVAGTALVACPQESLNSHAFVRRSLSTPLCLQVLVSGLLCFVLEKNWFINMSPGLKVPLYSILGVAVCFALLFSIIDLLNYCCGMCQANNEDVKPLVETETQVYLVVTAAVIMGFIFGLVFGMLDVEDADMAHLKVALLREESICYPIGAVLGGIASSINQYLREEADDYTFNTLDDDLDDDEEDYFSD